MPNQIQSSKDKCYDLEERTVKFSKNILYFFSKNKPNQLNESIIKQLIKSATSIGANYWEANGAESKKDFKHKIAISKKENEIKALWQEAKELTLIFSAINKK